MSCFPGAFMFLLSLSHWLSAFVFIGCDRKRGRKAVSRGRLWPLRSRLLALVEGGPMRSAAVPCVTAQQLRRVVPIALEAFEKFKFSGFKQNYTR